MTQKRFSQILDIGYLFPFGFIVTFPTVPMVKFSKKFYLQPNGKRYPRSGKSVFLSCNTPQHCEISAKSEQGLRIFEGKMRFSGFDRNTNSGEMRRVMAI